MISATSAKMRTLFCDSVIASRSETDGANRRKHLPGQQIYWNFGVPNDRETRAHLAWAEHLSRHGERQVGWPKIVVEEQWVKLSDQLRICLTVFKPIRWPRRSFTFCDCANLGSQLCGQSRNEFRTNSDQLTGLPHDILAIILNELQKKSNLSSWTEVLIES